MEFSLCAVVYTTTPERLDCIGTYIYLDWVLERILELHTQLGIEISEHDWLCIVVEKGCVWAYIHHFACIFDDIIERHGVKS